MTQRTEGNTETQHDFGNQMWKIKADKSSRKNTPCLWMESGAVKKMYCNNFYDCVSCSYDNGMKKKVAKGTQISWQDSMRKRESMDRICRHSLTKRISKRACPYNYQCSSCDFDQYFEDVLSPRHPNHGFDVRNVKGFDVATGCYFHEGHTWARIENGGMIKIGLDDFSLKLLGQADALDLPLTGKELTSGVPGWGLKKKDDAASVLSPIDGIIMEVNSKIRQKPALANQSPYSDGWLFSVHTPDVKKTIRQLMTDSEGAEWTGSEVNRLENMIEEVTGPISADGGFLKENIIGNLPGLGWNNVTRMFLRS